MDQGRLPDLFLQSAERLTCLVQVDTEVRVTTYLDLIFRERSPLLRSELDRTLLADVPAVLVTSTT